MSKAITLTEEQLTDLETYILMTTDYRKRERETWKKLGEERSEEGKPRFPNAESNSLFWEEMDARLNEIAKIIHGV